jgi:hypothetical protein
MHDDSSGITHISELLTIDGSGVGQTSRAAYELDDVTQTKIKVRNPFPFSFREKRVSDLVGVGVPDQHIVFNTVLTINANGNIKHDLFLVKLTCNP